MRHLVISFVALVWIMTAGARDVAAEPREVRIVALGDSLTAGYLLAASDAFPAKLQAALRARGERVVVENAGVSGDTTAGGLDRLDWSVGDGVDAVIVELGGNDALRGVAPETTRRNLDAIVTRLKARGLVVLLSGMIAPPNMGPDYARAFNPIFAELAARHDILFDPFFLEGVAAQPALNLPDGVHPNPAGVDVIVARIAPRVVELVAAVRRLRGG